MGADLHVDIGHTSLGRLLLPQSDPAVAGSCDLVFCGKREGRVEVERAGVLNKTIFYEFRDRCTVEPAFLGGMAYFKRSVFCGPERTTAVGPFKPINYAALDEYYLDGEERVYDIGCFFDEKNPQIGDRRMAILRALQRRNPANSLIGHSTAYANGARLAVNDPPEDNKFLEFIRLQHQVKIIFTAQPWPVDGDNRTWEAMASGALVFMDKCFIPTPDWPEDGVHCCHYDATDPYSVQSAIERAEYYIKNEAERKRIARTGYEFVRQKHRGINRVRDMLRRSGWSGSRIKML